MKYLITLLLIIPFVGFSQIDTSLIKRLKAFDTANLLKLDTLPVVDDAFTNKVKLLRSERRGLTIETIIRVKIMEDQEKDTSRPKAFYDKLLEEVTVGKTGKLIDNSMANIYRRSFTEKEVDDLIAFYKTSAGKKMDEEYILLLVQSVKDVEQLLKIAAKNVTLNK